MTDITGVSDKKADAVTALATLGTTAVTQVGDLGRYLARILGTVPEDLVGFTIGDPLRFIRTASAAWYDQRLGEICQKRGVTEPLPLSPSLAIPLVRAAYDETRPELREMWAQLIASAMDPTKAGSVRGSFIEILSKFDPLDALVLRETCRQTTVNLQYDSLSELLNVSTAEVTLSVDNLEALQCAFRHPASQGKFIITPRGHALYCACSDD